MSAALPHDQDEEELTRVWFDATPDPLADLSIEVCAPATVRPPRRLMSLECELAGALRHDDVVTRGRGRAGGGSLGVVTLGAILLLGGAGFYLRATPPAISGAVAARVTVDPPTAHADAALPARRIIPPRPPSSKPIARKPKRRLPKLPAPPPIRDDAP